MGRPITGAAYYAEPALPRRAMHRLARPRLAQPRLATIGTLLCAKLVVQLA